MVPTEGVIIITVPLASMVPSISDFSMTCSSGCDSSSPTLTWSSGTKQLTVTGAFGTAVKSTPDGGSKIIFNISGWTNPPDSTTYDFTASTTFVDSSTCSSGCAIEDFSGMSITAAEGVCYVQTGYVTDADTRIYAQVTSYTFTMWCNHEIDSTMGLRILFPSDFIVMDRSSCTFTGYNNNYYCQTLSDTNEILIREFTTDTIAAKTVLEFTIDSVISPGTYDDTGAITLSTMDSSLVNVDVGTWTFDAGYFT